MIKGTTIPRQTLPMLAAAALLLVAITVLAVWFNAQQDEQRRNVERDALDHARQVVMLADSEANASGRILSLLSTSPAMADNAQLAAAFKRQLTRNPGWRALVLRDAKSGQVLLELPDDDRSRQQPLRALPAAAITATRAEGVFRDGRFCPCVIVHAPVPGSSRVLTLYMDPKLFQDMLPRQKVRGLVAVVDDHGRFLGRSLHFADRVGLPGSVYLRRAVAVGGEGFYPGVTLEGRPNYTAYYTSPQTGWSGHVAVDSSEIDNPRGWANASVVMAILAALVLSVGLSFYAVYETRRRRLEEARLVGMQKAEAISRFTGTMAHDFRNILSVIDACVRLIVRNTDDEQTAKRAQSIDDAVERGNRLVNQLLSFVRGDGAEVGPLDLRKCIGSADELLERSLGEGIVFRWTVDEDARHVRVNADQFELALLNLAINARDAMEGRGEFTLTVTREDAFAAIAACDTGPGVPAHLRERIFEAFYSTKGDGKGTGLGLAQVAGAARQAGGRVELKDSPAGGACFVIYLPLEDASAS